MLLINVPVALTAICRVTHAVAEWRDSNAPPKIDVPGIALVVVGIAAVTFAVDRSAGWGLGSPDTLDLLALGVLLLAGSTQCLNGTLCPRSSVSCRNAIRLAPN